MGQLIIDGNSVYEVDEECLRNKRVDSACKIREALERQEAQRRAENPPKAVGNNSSKQIR